MFRRHNARPNVKKVSALVNPSSHKQRKYISLMLVPSYSTGKTRSLRIPRVVFYCILATVLAVSAITTGFYLRSVYFSQELERTEEYLATTQDAFNAFQAQTEEEQLRLMEEAMQVYEQLTEEQRIARIEQHMLRMEQQRALQEILNHIDELEYRLREIDEARQAFMDGLSARTIIPPVATLFNSMLESQTAIASQSVLLNGAYYDDYAPAAAELGFVMFFDEQERPPQQVSEEELHERIAFLMNELEIQFLLMECMQYYRNRMDPHLRNFPSLWPITAQISSHFGWRRNPFGGSGSEFHHGIDLRAPTGTNIRAAGGGTVTFQGWRSGYGNVVIINHGHGLETLYAHNSVNLVTVGQRVERGDIIARVGTTGRTTGAHLHYEVIRNGVRVNPRPYMLEHWS